MISKSIRAAKCAQVTYQHHLGVILGRGVTHMDHVKISGIKDWPTPTKVKDVHSFLSFCNFYHIFIWGFANHA